jgi:hypothetical protein
MFFCWKRLVEVGEVKKVGRVGRLEGWKVGRLEGWKKPALLDIVLKF